jgi:hypothetical protein
LVGVHQVVLVVADVRVVAGACVRRAVGRNGAEVVGELVHRDMAVITPVPMSARQA